MPQLGTLTRATVRKRRMRSPRYPIAGFRRWGFLNVIHPGMLVVPGDTMTSLRMRLQSRSLILKQDLAPAYLDYWLAYVPLRLVWGGWHDWMASNGEDGDIPTTASPNPWLGVHKVGNANPLPYSKLLEAAYLAVASHTMLRPEGTAFVPSAATPLARLPSVDFGAEIFTADETEGDEIEMLVEAGADGRHGTDDDRVVLTLDMIRNALMKEAFQKEQDAGNLDGNANYDDFLELYGVKVNRDQSSLITEPELLHLKRDFLWPTRYTEPSTGVVGSRYQEVQDIAFKRKVFFPEHGFVMLLSGQRCTEFLRKKVGLLAHQRVKPEHFIPPFMEFDPEIRSAQAPGTKQWLFNEPDVHVDGREELFKGEQVLTGPIRTGAETDAQAEARLFLTSDAWSQSDLYEAGTPSFIADEAWPDSAHLSLIHI